MDLFNHKMITARHSAQQFKVFRIVLGSYLLLHFSALLPYSAEMFSNEGIFGSADLNFSYGYFPDWLYFFDSAMQVRIFMLVLIALSILFIVGFHRRVVALLLWYGWACLLNRNNLIINPGIPYIGWLLLVCAFIPGGENQHEKKWNLPAWCLPGAWVLMSVGYTISGLDKLQSPSWTSGETFSILLDNPLSRNTLLRDWSLHIPDAVLQVITWSVLLCELLFLPLALFERTRKYAWMGMVSMHLCILCYINFTDLTLGMLMIHVFTFDRKWLGAYSSVSWKPIFFRSAQKAG